CIYRECLWASRRFPRRSPSRPNSCEQNLALASASIRSCSSPSPNIVEERALARRSLLECHVAPHRPQRLPAKHLEIAADRPEDSTLTDMLLVSLPGLEILEAAMQGHVAAVAQSEPADVIAEGLAIIFRMRLDHTLGLPACIAA